MSGECPTFDGLSRLLDGDDADSVILAHLDGCPACQRRLRQLEPDLAVPPPPTTAEEPTRPFLNSLKQAVRAVVREPGAADWPRVPGYEIVSELGRGGMGVVYQARDVQLGRMAALKFLPADAPVSPAEMMRLRREAKALAALRHPNVVQLYGVGDLNGRPYLILEFVDGGTLAHALRTGPWPATNVAALMRSVADAVAAAHAAGIIHRDLKPSNILLDGAGDSGLVTGAADGASRISWGHGTKAGKNRTLGDFFPGPQPPAPSPQTPKVSDFGLALLSGAERLTVSGMACGTPEYMAPEQTLGRPAVIGPACDVWAMGAILYEVLTGRPPFAGPTADVLAEQIRNADLLPLEVFRPDVPADLAAICRTCLEKSPRDRYPSAAAMRDDLDRFLRDEPVRVRRPSARRQVSRWFRRRREMLVILGVVMTLAVGKAWAWWHVLTARADAAVHRDRAEAATRLARTAEQTTYATAIAWADAAINAGRPDEAKAALGAAKPSADVHGWEWGYLHNRLAGTKPIELHVSEAARHTGAAFPHATPVSRAVTRDGRRAAEIDGDGRLTIRVAATRRDLLRLPLPAGTEPIGLHFSDDDRWLAVRTRADTIILFDGGGTN